MFSSFHVFYFVIALGIKVVFGLVVFNRSRLFTGVTADIVVGVIKFGASLIMTPHRSYCCSTVSWHASSNVLEQWAQSIHWNWFDLLHHS